MPTTTEHPTIVVLDADSALGTEVAQMAFSYGSQVVAITAERRSAFEERWMQGVQWGIPSEVETTDGPVVLVAPSGLRGSYPDELDVSRLVVVGERKVRVPAGLQVVTARPERIETGAIGESMETAGDDWIHVQRLAMAVLRLAVEDDVPQSVDHGALCDMGDAVFLVG